jgi:hypothetical protein
MRFILKFFPKALYQFVKFGCGESSDGLYQPIVAYRSINV